MAKRVEYIVQSFEHRRRSLVAGPRDLMWNADDAIKRAIVQSFRFPGVVALMIVTEIATNAVSDVSVLRQFGDVPGDFIDRVRQS